MPRLTATADPDEEPPGINSASRDFVEYHRENGRQPDLWQIDQVDLGDTDGASFDELLHHRSVGSGLVSIARAASRGRCTGIINIIFDHKRDAGQGTGAIKAGGESLRAIFSSRLRRKITSAGSSTAANAS